MVSSPQPDQPDLSSDLFTRAQPFRRPLAAAKDLTLWDRCLDFRDRMTRSATFQKLATAIPGLRGMAHRRARDLFDICAGFVYSQVLDACIETGLFRHLAQGPLTLEEIAARIDMPIDGADRLIRAAVSLDLAGKRSRGRYGLGGLGAAVLGNKGVAEMVRHHRLLYQDLADPVALLRGDLGAEGTALGRYWAYAGNPKPKDVTSETAESYSALMSASQEMIAGDVADAYTFGRHWRVLDIGGGTGVFSSALAARFPELNISLFDLPPVAAQARARFQTVGLGGRIQTVGGDFFRDDLPTDADVITMVRVAFDHDDAAVVRLLRNIHRALPKDGCLILAEPMAETPGAEPIGDAYFGFYLRAMGDGRVRTREHLSRLMQDAGFVDIEEVPSRRPLMVRVLRAMKGRGLGPSSASLESR